MSSKLQILGISCSLRKESFNTKLLNNIIELVPAEMVMHKFDISAIPLYNGDVEAAGFPQPVADLRQIVIDSDGVLIVSPEYNHSIPGVTKNMIDWVSRPPVRPWNEKPVAITGASDGMYGTVRAQKHLRYLGATANMLMLNKPELMVGRAQEKFDSNGKLIDDKLAVSIKEFLNAFRDWIYRLKK